MANSIRDWKGEEIDWLLRGRAYITKRISVRLGKSSLPAKAIREAVSVIDEFINKKLENGYPFFLEGFGALYIKHTPEHFHKSPVLEGGGVNVLAKNECIFVLDDQLKEWIDKYFKQEEEIEPRQKLEDPPKKSK